MVLDIHVMIDGIQMYNDSVEVRGVADWVVCDGRIRLRVPGP